MALLSIDLNKFKQINDTLGHSIGDFLLQATAIRLTSCVHESDTVARVGGDEFVILLQGPMVPGYAARVAEKIQERFAVPFVLKGQPLTMIPSIGFTSYPQHGTSERQRLECG